MKGFVSPPPLLTLSLTLEPPRHTGTLGEEEEGGETIVGGQAKDCDEKPSPSPYLRRKRDS